LASAPEFPKNVRLITPDSSSPATSSPHVHAIRGWQRTLLAPLGWLVRLWGWTLRLEASPDALRNLRKIDEPLVIAMWHNRLFLASEIFRRYRQRRPAYCLISASKDGAWLEVFFALVGMRSVRGSSSRLGREAVTALVNVLREGHDVGITPDGPRGPRYDFKAGGLIVARRSRVPMLLLGCAFESAWQLGSWDGFWLPKPFSRVHVYCELVRPDELRDRQEATEQLRERLLAINSDEMS
jgi:lysophospholipid acyltransferase (LPLAT)-like uncharacterized protein